MVRPATVHDVPGMVQALHAFQLETSYRDDPQPPVAHTVEILHIMLRNTAEWGVFVLEDAGRIVGLIIGVLTFNPFFPDRLFVCEQSWFVYPEYRKKRAGLALLRALQAWGVERGVQWTVTDAKWIRAKRPTIA